MTTSLTEEDRELLLSDLSGRLPYGVKVDRANSVYTLKNVASDGSVLLMGDPQQPAILSNVYIIKPYLRAMSDMSDDEVSELLHIRLSAIYGESCLYIRNLAKINDITYRKEEPYTGSISVWFSYLDNTRVYSKIEFLGLLTNITLSELDWLNKNHFDYRGLIEKGLAIAVTPNNNPYA